MAWLSSKDKTLSAFLKNVESYVSNEWTCVCNGCKFRSDFEPTVR